MLALVKPEPEVEISFDDFWKAYPRRQNKKAALVVWKRIDVREHPAILEGVANWRQSDQWNRDNGQFIPLPSTFLAGERWADELEIAIAALALCSWPKCKSHANAKFGSRDYCESHVQAFKRGETP